MALLLLLLGFAGYALQAFASWAVTYPENVQGVKASCVLIPCTFSYPSDVVVTEITAIWYKDYASQRTVVYHSATPNAVDAQFRDRTELLGDPLARNCSLLLRSVTTEDSGVYLFRFEMSERNRWSAQRRVQMTITDVPAVPTIALPENLQEGTSVTFSCSSPYVCPYSSISLRWVGYNPEAAFESRTVLLDTARVLRTQTLNTSLSWQDHNRKMSCALSVGTQTQAGQVILNVKHSPKGLEVSLNPSTKNIRVGDAASLTCNVNSSYPEVTAYRWYKDGVARGNERVKTIRSAARSDYGLYYCEAENSVGTGVAEAVTLYVFSAVLLVSPSSHVREGEMVTLTCDVPGEDTQEIYYSWYKNNVWIKEGTARSLVFHEVAVGDTGYYSCKVQNDKGSEVSQAVSLSIFYPPRTPSLALFQETQEGKLAIVYCTVDSNPQSALSLYRDKQLIATTNAHSAPSQRIQITTTRNSLKLEIQKVLPEDQGEYQCVASNTYGNASSTRFFGAQSARVLVSPSSEVTEGEQVTLTCLATLGPEEGTTYTWYKNAKWLQGGKEDNALVFPVVTRADAGTFHCVAQNRKGSNTSPAVTLRVLYLPAQPVMSSFLETQGGHLGILQCTVDSDPPSEIALRKGPALVGSTSESHPPADPRVSVTLSHNTLRVTIKDVTLEDEGEYVCSAHNRYGNASASMDFTAETAKIIIRPSSEVPEGEEAQLSCAVSGDSSALANYSWYRNGLRLSEALGSSLVFTRVARGEAGAYSCRVETQSASKSSAPATLSVLYPPEEPQVAVFVETERGRVAIFQCSVDSNPPSKLVLQKGNEVVAFSGSETSTASQRVSITTASNTLRVEVRGVGPEDEGSYNLTATNPYGSSSRLLYFRVQTARVLVEPSPELLEGDALTLTCDTMGSAPEDATFSWYKNSKRLQDSDSGALAFQHVTSSDAGSYHCKAHPPDKTGTSISPSVSITVFYPPRQPRVSSFLQTQDGQVAIIHCTVDSEPQAQLAVRKGGVLLASSFGSSTARSHRVSSSVTYNSLRLEIRDVVMEDEGDYLCSATNPYGTMNSSVMLKAENVLEGHSVNLTCAVDSDTAGQPHYTWYKNSRWLAEGPSKTLALPNITVADAGYYHCTVQTPERSRNSSLGTLNVLYPPRNARLRSFLDSPNGKAAIIVCTVDSNPLSELSLLRASKVLAASAFRVRSGEPNHRLSAVSSSNSLRLEIKDICLDDEGIYECLSSNAIGQTSTSLDLTVETTRVVIQPGSDIREGDPVSLTCEDASAPSEAVYTWYKNSKWQTEGSAASLRLQAVTPADTGAYACQVRHEKGVRKSPPASLQVLYAPRKPSLTSFLETQTGNQAVIQCAVESHPPSDLALYRGAEMVASSRSSGTLPAPRFKVHLASNVLKVEIKKVLLEDEGQFLCSANNTYGTSTAVMHFSVESARITVEPSPDIQEGATINLTCVVVGQTMGEMNYTWYRNSKWLQEGLEPWLVLQEVTREDAGSYHCQASGLKGSVTSALVILNVFYAPKNPSISAFLENRNGKVGIIRCKVDSHPRSELAFFKGGQLLVGIHSPHSTASQRFAAVPSYNSLRLEIQDVTAEDSGHYTCQARNFLGNVTSTVHFDAEILSDLHLFKILAGIFIAATCAAVLCGLALGVQKNWNRINEEWKRMRLPKVKQAVSVGNKDEMAQLNEQHEATLSPGRFWGTYKRLWMKTEAPPREGSEQNCCTAL
ncbi:sialoadhesin isoform X2 [Tiliqua scincoides]|uniref:sialoadhesin isoform X2 n=1 Tax=Tiliqua scincoides TaxID=71010 RepID=UPI00346378E7